MEFLIFGAGQMAQAVGFDLVRQPDVERVYVVDNQLRQLRRLQRFLNSSKIRPVHIPATAPELKELLARCQAAISCIPYNYNLRLTRMAIAAGTNFCDLGGNNTVVRRQLALDRKARTAGCTVIPDCGLAPGMTNILVADAVSRLDRTETVRIRVGGLPVKPQPPLFYKLVFSAQGLLNEYAEPCLVLRSGKIQRVKALTEPETVIFPPPFGRLEAFHTSGGASTLPETFQRKIRELDYKTIRYPGHRLMFELIMKSAVGNWRRLPRAELACALEKVLGWETDDVVLLRIEVTGIKNGSRRLLRYQLIDYADKKTGLTAMMRTTGFSAAIVSLMLARKQIPVCGAQPGEKAVPAGRFIAELRHRGLNLTIRSVKL
ncbi:MAG: saccharopine dehydrogenase NADP-binding domain-containing protein [candidate division WOR-3 bacterium]|uniref:Saccharopine dehydrogenase n=1 Tax=candidate division WOR-3 bacterium TaxID=2052148 RepID=A0A7C3IBG3_UNCW3|nr:saccharopine dehydrogenase NADP-binding domain-containing protein [candidate division WOR-3 bacterium]